MLSELPKACQAVLQADPDPVKIPREALMTGAAVRQVLAKAAAVKAALAKAAATPGAQPAATGATRSPALRPYMRKTVAAEKK
jgi:penicillin-insensitive murein endopeptidase